nr:MAG TPA: waglerin family protein [Caudoviricetes sp.]
MGLRITHPPCHPRQFRDPFPRFISTFPQIYKPSPIIF